MSLQEQLFVVVQLVVNRRNCSLAVLEEKSDWCFRHQSINEAISNIVFFNSELFFYSEFIQVIIRMKTFSPRQFHYEISH